jgi:anti-sigma regulatory factor (Ser/Thr protein kinase)
VPGSHGPCREVALRRSNEVEPLLEDLTAALARPDSSERDRLAVRLALTEAITNEGPSFDPAAVPDPTLPENLDQPNGRGLLMMRRFMTALRFWGRGNCVTLCKRPSA